MLRRPGPLLPVVLGCSALLCLPALLRPTTATAQVNDPVTVTPVESGTGKVAFTVTAGPSGAQGGFSVMWMKLSDFQARGGQWSPGGAPGQMQASFSGRPTLNTDGGAFSTYQLDPNQTVTIEIGDLFDETGVATISPSELEPGVTYVAVGFANAGGGLAQSTLSNNVATGTMPLSGCTFTQGYWKNHGSVWPATSLTLGTVTYTEPQLLSILDQAAKGNGLVSLAHQLIATKLNILNGADPTAIAGTVSVADGLMAGRVIPPVGTGFLSPSATDDLTEALDDYNNGITGPGHCETTPSHTTTWGQLKAMYR